MILRKTFYYLSKLKDTFARRLFAKFARNVLKSVLYPNMGFHKLVVTLKSKVSLNYPNFLVFATTVRICFPMSEHLNFIFLKPLSA